MIEVYGLVAAFAACDAGCKAADVTVEPFDKNKPARPEGLEVPLIILVKFRGTVENVTAAVEAAAAAANRVSGVVSSHVIPNVTEGADRMLHLNAFDKK
jgi:microcompartment protein CcmL/EutN